MCSTYVLLIIFPNGQYSVKSQRCISGIGVCPLIIESISYLINYGSTVTLNACYVISIKYQILFTFVLQTNGYIQEILQKVDVIIYNDSICSQAYYGALHLDHHVCAGWPNNGRGSCQVWISRFSRHIFTTFVGGFITTTNGRWLYQ